MKPLAVVVGLLVLIPAAVLLAQTAALPKTAGPEQELLDLELAWSSALVSVDIAFLDRILADDLSWTDPSGVVWTKAQTLASLKSGEDIISSLKSDDMKVRVYGNAAVVTGRDEIKEKLRGKDVSGLYRWTDTWIKTAGRWQCVATHASKITART